MSFDTRLLALEKKFEPPTTSPQAREFFSAQRRREARATREYRALLERAIMEAAEGRPIEFTEELGQIFGMPGLWRPSTIQEEDSLLYGDLGTEEQGRKDDDIFRRWCLSIGVDPERSTNTREHEHEIEKLNARLQRLCEKLGLEGVVEYQ